MPILLQTAWEEGWKRKDASNPIFVVKFIDINSGKVLFTYGAKVEEVSFWLDYLKVILRNEFEKDNKLCKRD